MVDIPKRVFGPGAVYGGRTQTVYTVPSAAKAEFYLRDITIVNPSSQAQGVRMTAAGTVFYLKDIVANTSSSYRGLLPMKPSQQITISQTTYAPYPTSATVAATGVAASPWVSGAWTPAADTLYILCTVNIAADAPGAVSTTSGNGTWTSIRSETSGSVAAKNDVRVSAFYWYSQYAGSSATTTVNFTSATNADGFIVAVPNVYRNAGAGTLFSTIVGDTGSATYTSAGSTTLTPGFFLDGFGGTGRGILLAAGARADMATNCTADSAWTDIGGTSAPGLFLHMFTGPYLDSLGYFTGGTWGTSTTDTQAAVLFELGHDIVNQSLIFTVNGVEIL